MSHLRVSSAGLLARVSGASFRQVCHEHKHRLSPYNARYLNYNFLLSFRFQYLMNMRFEIIQSLAIYTIFISVYGHNCTLEGVRWCYRTCRPWHKRRHLSTIWSRTFLWHNEPHSSSTCLCQLQVTVSSAAVVERQLVAVSVHIRTDVTKVKLWIWIIGVPVNSSYGQLVTAQIRMLSWPAAETPCCDELTGSPSCPPQKKSLKSLMILCAYQTCAYYGRLGS